VSHAREPHFQAEKAKKNDPLTLEDRLWDTSVFEIFVSASWV
jgi:hypothetical protein